MKHDDPTEERRRHEAYRAACSDVEAAEMLGLLRCTFTRWRMTRGLAPKRKRGRPLKVGIPKEAPHGR